MTHSWHSEPHFIERNNWLRAAVLGANDGLISTSSLLMGMVAAGSSVDILLLAACASLVAGAVSMAAGEYVSVSSQTDTEQADLKTERRLLNDHPEEELAELTTIYMNRGLDEKLASQVAQALMHHDDLDAHARDELGITETSTANPLQAAGASAFSFAVGAIIPVSVIFLVPETWLMYAIIASTLIGLALLGYVSAKLGGSKPLLAVVRIIIWGIVALSVTSFIGNVLGIHVA